MICRLLLILLVLSSPALAQTGQIASGTIWGNNTASARPPTQTTLTAIIDRAISSTRGSILYRGAAGWVALPPGTATNTLQSGGPGADPAWASGGSGTVTSVGYTAGTGLALSGTASPITSSGTFTYSLAAIAADTLLMNATGSSAAPTAVSVGSCSGTGNALTYNTTTHAFGCSTLVTSVSITAGTGITQSGSPVTTSGAITVNVDKATAANYYAAASNKVPTTDIIYPSSVVVTYGTTTTFDFDTFINAEVTLTGNITTMTFSNIRSGKAGMILFRQDATGSRTTVWNSNLKWTNGSAPTLSTAANSIDVLFYNCYNTSYCVASLQKATN